MYDRYVEWSQRTLKAKNKCDMFIHWKSLVALIEILVDWIIKIQIRNVIKARNKRLEKDILEKGSGYIN